jgi:ketosteroid isomerase-like protein
VWDENVRVVVGYFDAVARNLKLYSDEPGSYARELENDESDPASREVLDRLHPDVRWRNVLGETCRGKLAFARGADELLQAAQRFEMVVDEITDLANDRVLVELRSEATGRSSGVAGTLPFFAVFALRDGLIIELDEYLNRSEALKAVGLEE